MNYTHPVTSARILPSLSFLRSRFTLAAIACLVSLATLSVRAQGTGTVTGRVLNAESGKYLSNATVAVEGTTIEALTDDYGYFELRNVPAGPVSLKSSYSGRQAQAASVTVVAGQTTTRDVTFAGSGTTSDNGTLTLDPFQVQAQRFRDARELAINEERNSINIKNVVSTDTYGAIPNGNVGEFVKFMPGIQIDYGASNGNNQGYSDSDANGVSVRGFGPEDTAILIDGLPVASTVPGNLTRQVGLDQLSINNAARIELIKVATPDMPNNSVGGQINLITRSAFEQAKPSYEARVFMNFNSLNTTLQKTPGPVNKKTYKTTPGLDFTVTYPFSSKIGLSFTGYAANEFGQSYRGQPVWNNNHAANYQNGAFINTAGKASSLSNPVLTRYQITDSPRITEKRSGNLKFDWRPTPSQLLRANVQYSTYETAEAARRLDFRPNIAPTGAEWDETKSVGTIANSTTAMTVTTRDRIGNTKSGQIQYTLNLGGWSFSAAGSLSISESDFKDEENGHFSEVAFNLNPGQVGLYRLDEGLVGGVVTRTRTTNLPLDYTVFSNWAFDGTTAKSGESHNESRIGLYKLDIERDLNFLPFIGSNSLSIKVGARRDEDENSKSGRGTGYRQILRPGASYTVADILDTDYIGRSPGFGLAGQQWGSSYKLYQVNKERDIFYVPDIDEATNTRVENYNSAVGQLKSIKETKDAWYAQLSGRFFKNRLSFVGGLRQEEQKRSGYSPFTDSKWNYIKRADGSLYTDAANPNGVQFDVGNGSVLNGVVINPPSNRPLFSPSAAGIALRQSLTAAGIAFPTIPFGPTSGANASLASRMLQFQPAKPVNAKQKGDPSYSMSTAFKLTKKIDLKLAWSRSFGLPKLEDAEFGLLSGTSNFSINDFTSTEEGSNGGALGEIRLANPNLKPSTSNNWDFEVAYYTESGGKLSAGYFYKTVTDQPITLTTFSGSPTFNAVLPVLGLDPDQYDNWRLATSTNAIGEQVQKGMEFEIRQDFAFLGGWGKHFQGFVSYSFTDLAEPSAVTPVTIQNPDGTPLILTPTARNIPQRANKFGGAGLQFASRRITAQVRGTYRNDNEVALLTSPAVNGNPIRRIQPAETRIDVNLNVMLTKRFSVFASARDVFNATRREELRDDAGLLAGYASLNDYREFGTVWTVGVNGKF